MTEIQITECDGCKRREEGSMPNLWKEVLIPQDRQHRDMKYYKLCHECFRRFRQVVLL